jgi:hypothetical protein
LLGLVTDIVEDDRLEARATELAGGLADLLRSL